MEGDKVVDARALFERRPDAFPVPALTRRKAPGIFECTVTVLLDSDNRQEAVRLTLIAQDAIEAARGRK